MSLLTQTTAALETIWLASSVATTSFTSAVTVSVLITLWLWIGLSLRPRLSAARLKSVATTVVEPATENSGNKVVTTSSALQTTSSSRLPAELCQHGECD